MIAEYVVVHEMLVLAPEQIDSIVSLRNLYILLYSFHCMWN